MLEPRDLCASNIRCKECGKRLYFGAFASAHLETVVMYGQNLLTLMMTTHIMSGHIVGTEEELERFHVPIPSPV
jgi:hypothetical protein